MAGPASSPVGYVLAPLIPGAVRLVAGLAAATLLALAGTAVGLTTLTGALFAGLLPEAIGSNRSDGPASRDRISWTVQPPSAVPPPLDHQLPPVSLSPPNGLGAAAVTLGRTQVGVPYVWGGTDPRTGVDCSGLMQWLYRQLGVALPRTAQQQYTATARVSVSELTPGDLVFFAQTYPSPSEWITHVGLYVGNGRMLNAPRPGEVVQEEAVFTGFWGAHYAGAGRITMTGARDVGHQPRAR
jgi:cell wall-associated NlpC family hydrolase